MAFLEMVLAGGADPLLSNYVIISIILPPRPSGLTLESMVLSNLQDLVDLGGKSLVLLFEVDRKEWCQSGFIT